MLTRPPRARFAALLLGLMALLVAVPGLVLPGLALPAAAAPGDGCQLVEAGEENGEIVYETVCPGDEGGGDGTPGGGGGGGAPTCDLSTVQGVADYPFCVGTTACAVNNPSSLPEESWPMEERPSPEHIYTWRWCETAAGEVDYEWSWYLPEEEGPSLEELAQQAFGALAPPTFGVGVNPPRQSVVGLPTWFWAATAQPGGLTGSSAGGVVALAAPDRLEVDPGDGSGVRSCPWTTAEADACTHTYARSSATAGGTSDVGPAYTARMRLVYDVTFQNNGAPLTLPGLPTTLESAWVTGAVPVAEIQSIVTSD